MTKTQTFNSIDPNGETHTRKSDTRSYTHTVVYQDNYEAELAYASKPQDVDGRNWDFACKMVAWGGVRNGVREVWESDESVAQSLKHHTARKGEFTSREAAIEGRRQERIAEVEKKKARGGYDVFRNAGWCGRRDLAESLASQKRKHNCLAVTILEAIKK